MSVVTRKENLWHLLEMLNLQLEECGYSLHYVAEKASDGRGILYMLRNAADRRSMGDWMTTNETIRALYAMHQMLPALHEPTPYQRIMEELQALNDHLVKLDLPYRHTIGGPEEGMYTLYLHDVVHGDGNALAKARYTEEGLIKRIRLQMVQANVIANKTEEEA